MKSRQTLGFVLLALLISSLVVFGVPDKSHASTLDDEHSYFSEYGAEYDGYVFAPLNRQVVKIPLDKDKINKNAEFVMNFPGDKASYYEENRIFSKNGSELYINFAAYMSHGGLFRMTSGSGRPELMVETSNKAGFITITNSNRHPETLKFLHFSESDAGEYWGELYGYLPHKNKVVKLTSFKGDMKIDDFIGITRDDAILISQFVKGSEYKMTHLEGVNRVTINPETGEVNRERLLNARDMPRTYFITPSLDMEKLYLFGTGFSVFDVKKGSLKKVVEFVKIIKNWPNNASPYLNGYYGSEVEEGESIFVIDKDRPGHFYILGDNKTMLIHAFDETYTSVKKIKGDNLW
jgi:hypothetical protein